MSSTNVPSADHILVRDYGCVKCQKYHREGDLLYEEHLYFQSKHSIREWNEHVETAMRLAVERAQPKDPTP